MALLWYIIRKVPRLFKSIDEFTVYYFTLYYFSFLCELKSTEFKSNKFKNFRKQKLIKSESYVTRMFNVFKKYPKVFPP